MLNRLDLQKIVDIAASCGFSFCEVYVESTRCLSHDFKQRLNSVQSSLDGGMSIRLWDGARFRLCASSTVTTEAAVSLIQKKYFERTPEVAIGETFATSLPPLEEIPAELTTILRPITRERALTIQSFTKFFEVFNSTGVRGHGRESWAKIASEIGGLNNLWAENLGDLAVVIATVPDRSEKATRWPIPQGKLPIYWSRRALSKVLLPFLRTFEGDLVLKRSSFLERLSDSDPLPFSIEDSPRNHLIAFDHEGSPRKSTVLLEEGALKEIACDNWIAQTLKVQSTGHCRRGSFRQSPTVSLWNPQIRGTDEQSNLLGSLSHGLYVEDIAIDDFDPAEAEVDIQFKETRLIYQGKPGELVEAIRLRTDLLSLLKTFRAFSTERKNSCLPIYKHGQELPTHILCPEAISEGLELPGSVPQSHYW